MITLEDAKGKVIYVRFHSGKIPGPYMLAFALEDLGDGLWEAKIAMEALTVEQRRQFRRVVKDHGGICCIKWARYPDGGEPYSRASHFDCSKAILPVLLTVEKKMLVSLSFDVKNDDGTDFAEVNVKYTGVPMSSVANMEGLLISGFLQPLVEISKGQNPPAAS